MPIKNIILIVQINAFLKVFNGKEILYINIIPMIPVITTFIVEYLKYDMLNNEYIPTESIIERTIVIDAGKDLSSMFLNKFPFTLSRFGSSAKMNEGIPIVIALNLSMSQRYFRDEYVEIYDLGIYDAFACYSDKVLTTKVFDYDSQDLRRDFDVRIVKNNNGKNDTLYFGLYQETLSIIECNYNTNTNKSSVAF